MFGNTWRSAMRQGGLPMARAASTKSSAFTASVVPRVRRMKTGVAEIPMAIIAEASLSFLGLGQQPPAPSWGSMLNTAKNYVDNAPWMAIWPGLSIFGLVLSFNLLGDGLRDALDPRQR